jgi:hypothetical protein
LGEKRLQILLPVVLGFGSKVVEKGLELRQGFAGLDQKMTERHGSGHYGEFILIRRLPSVKTSPDSDLN